MLPEQEKRVAKIEAQLAEIDSQISALQKERECVLKSDEEYAGYLDWYYSFFTDEPLSLRQYYEFSEELENINQESMTAPRDEFEAVWAKHRSRLTFLERRLAA